MTFRVYETVTGREVTSQRAWFIDPDGDLRYLTDDKEEVGFPLALASADKYHYVLEIEVV